MASRASLRPNPGELSGYFKTDDLFSAKGKAQ
jgi:hypothetical protein